jgi:hypothetical protein
MRGWTHKFLHQFPTSLHTLVTFPSAEKSSQTTESLLCSETRWRGVRATHGRARMTPLNEARRARRQLNFVGFLWHLQTS